MARSKYELITEKALKALGFITDYKCRPSFPIKGYNVDYFGLFDHLAYDPKTKTLHMIQVKGHSGIGSDELKKKIATFEVSKVVKEIWTYRVDGSLKKETFH